MFDNYDNCFKVIIINFNFFPLILRKNNEKKICYFFYRHLKFEAQAYGITLKVLSKCLASFIQPKI